MRDVEIRLSQFKSLRNRMTLSGDWEGTDAFVTSLLLDKNVSLSGGSHTPAGTALLKAFELTDVSFFQGR